MKRLLNHNLNSITLSIDNDYGLYMILQWVTLVINVTFCFQAKFHEERLSAVLQDREVQKKEAEAYHNSASQKVRDLTDRLGKTETALQQTARNFILGTLSQYQNENIHQKAVIYQPKTLDVSCPLSPS